MKYRIEFRASARRDFKKLGMDVQQQIAPVIDALATNPRPSGVVKLANEGGLYRVRCGDYRIVYDIQDGVLLVLVVKVAKRGDVYKKRK